MNRNRTIATVAATTGIFAATVVAGISILQASVASDPVSDLPVLTAQSVSTDPGAELSFTPAPLPELPTLTTTAPSTSSAKPNADGKSAPATIAATTSTAATTTTISRADAQSIVLAATKGKVTSVEKVTRAGLAAFAVTVERSDGSVITGYVDEATGTAFDWVVNKEAPAPAATYNDDDHDEDDDREYEEDDDDDEDEREEHEGDDDDD